MTYNPLADGAYPPRLLTPDGTIWLSPWTDITILPGEVHVWNADGICRIARLPTASNREILLNGAPLSVEHVLQDGDFYWDGQDRFIFQADPVVDRKHALAAESLGPILISAEVAAKLRFDAAGITGIEAGITIPWLEITRLHIRDVTIFTREFRVWTDADRPALRVKFGYRPLKQVITWLNFALPFNIAVTRGQNTVLSPYELAVQTKVLSPVVEGRRILPADEAVLLAHPPQGLLRRGLAFLGSVVTLGSFLYVLLTDPIYLGWVILATIGFNLALFAIYLAVRRIRSAFRKRS